MVVFGDHVAAFVSERLGFGLCPPFVGMGLQEADGNIRCGIILNHFEGEDVHLTAAGTGWTRGFLDAVGRYVFGQLKCERMTAVTETADVVRLAIRLGGEMEGHMRNHFGRDRHAFIVGILRDNWRYAKV